MSIKTVEAQLVLGGKDNGASAAVMQVVKAYEQHEKASKGVSKSAETMAKALLDVERQQRAVDAVLSAQKGATAAEAGMQKLRTGATAATAALDKARTAFSAFEGQKPAKGSELAAQMTAAAKALATAERAQKAATREIAQGERAIEQQTRALRDAEKAATAASVPLKALEQHQRHLAQAYDQTSGALRQQIRLEEQAARATQHHAREQAEAAKHMRQHGAIGLAAGAVAGAVSAHGVTHTIGHAARAGADVQGARVDMAKAGIGFAERQHIAEESLRYAAKYKNVTQAGVMELWKETRSAVTHPEEVDHVMDALVRAKSLLDAKDKTGAASENLNLLIKGAESIGAAQSPERLIKLVDGYMKAIQVMGKTINPEDIYLFDKYSKDAGANLSDRFLMTTAQSLTQELKGNTAGLGIAGFYKELSGGLQNQHGAAQALGEIGLIDKKNLDYLKTGEIKGLKKGVKHGVKGDDLAPTDPDKWVWDVLVPAMEAHGYKSQLDQLAFVKKAFPNGNVSNTVSKLITQRGAFEAHAHQYNSATGLAGTDLNRSDPTAALGEVTKSLETFLGVVTSPIMVQAAHGLDDIATTLSGWSLKLDAFNKAHPDLAKVEAPAAAAAGLAASGFASYKIATGFGLPASAAALDASAAALTEAAVVLGGEGVVQRMGKMGLLAGLGPAGITTAVLGAIMVAASDPKKAIAAGGRPDSGVQMNPGDELPGLPGSTDAPSWAPRTAPSMTLAPGAMPLTIQGTGLSGFGLSGPVSPQAAGTEAGEKVGGGIVEGLKAKGAEVVDQAQSLFDRLSKIFSQGIVVPLQMSFDSSGMGGGSGIQAASFGGGVGGGGLIHKASLGGGGGGSSGGGGGGGGPMPAIPASVEMTGAERNALGLIMRHESHGQNVMNYVGRGQGLDPTTARGYTAQGYFQMLNSNWRRIAPKLGITAPNAMSGSLEDQTRVALHLLRHGGIGNWSRYNPALRAALARGDRVPAALKDAAALDPHLVKGLDGQEGLDLGNGTMRMPSGAIRSIPPRMPERTVPDAPRAGLTGSRGSEDHVVDRLHGVVDRMEDMSWRSHHTVEVNAGPGLTAKTKRARMQTDGPVRGNVGISMPGAEGGVLT